MGDRSFQKFGHTESDTALFNRFIAYDIKQLRTCNLQEPQGGTLCDLLTKMSLTHFRSSKSSISHTRASSTQTSVTTKPICTVVFSQLEVSKWRYLNLVRL